MIFFANMYGLIIGITLGISIAMAIMISFIKKSNDIGDSKGDFYDFGDYLKTINHMDNLRTKSTHKKNFFDNLFK